MILKLGKYRGRSITQCDKDYLKYLLTQDWLQFDLREAITAHLKGEYVSPVALPEIKERTAPYDPDIMNRLVKVKKDAARRVLHDTAQEIETIDGITPECKGLFLSAMLRVAERIR